jgi:hypothetical protein
VCFGSSASTRGGSTEGQQDVRGGVRPTAAPAHLLSKPYLVLASHIPHSEADVFVLNSFHVEACKRVEGGSARVHASSRRLVNNYPPLTNGGDGGHNLSQLELVQDGCLTSSIQSNLHKNHVSKTFLPSANSSCHGSAQRAPSGSSSPSWL